MTTPIQRINKLAKLRIPMSPEAERKTKTVFRGLPLAEQAVVARCVSDALSKGDAASISKAVSEKLGVNERAAKTLVAHTFSELF